MEAVQITKLAAEQGLFTLLFVVLFVYQIKSSDKREERMLKAKQDIQSQSAKLQEDSKERERVLMEHHEKTLEVSAKLNESIANLEIKISQDLDKVWKKIRKNQEEDDYNGRDY